MQRILVVEDEPLIYDAIKAALTFKGGYAFAYAPDGDAAIRELTDRAPDLALIDVYLPKRSGTEVADVAAAQQVPVILMSGHPKVLTEPEKYRFPILAKPFRLSYLLERFDELVAEAERLKLSLTDLPAPGSSVAVGQRWGEAAERWQQRCNRLLGEIKGPVSSW